MERVNIFFLHGFLGRPNDWDEVVSSLPKDKQYFFYQVDYFNVDGLGPEKTFTEWAGQFNNWARIQIEDSQCEKLNMHVRNILVGYSLGGRLALHALEQSRYNDLWDKVILISTNSGFFDGVVDSNLSAEIVCELNEERKSRWHNDSQWFCHFSDLNWVELLSKWNSQAVFSESKSEPLRIESDYSRKNLALSLKNWSLAIQRDMRFVLRENSKKIIWIVGEKDKKFVNLSAQLKNEIAEIQMLAVAEASHRVLFDQPLQLAKKITQFICD